MMIERYSCKIVQKYKGYLKVCKMQGETCDLLKK